MRGVGRARQRLDAVLRMLESWLSMAPAWSTTHPLRLPLQLADGPLLTAAYWRGLRKSGGLEEAMRAVAAGLIEVGWRRSGSV